MADEFRFLPLSPRKLKNLEKRFADYSRSDDPRFAKQSERLLNQYSYEVFVRMRLDFERDIQPYAEALSLCEVGWAYPLGVTRGNADFFQGLASLHIEELVYGTNGRRRWPFGDSVVAENVRKLTDYYARRYQEIVDEKDRIEDWKYGFSGWYGCNDGEHGDQCKRCAYHGESRYCCKYCNRCHHCFPFYAEMDYRYIDDYNAHLAFLERCKTFTYEVIQEGLWHFVAKVEARNDQREISAYRRASANYRTYELGKAYTLRDELNSNAHAVSGVLRSRTFIASGLHGGMSGVVLAHKRDLNNGDSLLGVSLDGETIAGWYRRECLVNPEVVAQWGDWVIYVKCENDSLSYDQSTYPIRVVSENENAWYGYNPLLGQTSEPSCYPKSAWKRIVPLLQS